MSPIEPNYTLSHRADQPDELSRAMLEISSLFESGDPLDAVLHRIVEITADLMQIPICSIYLVEEDGTLRKRSNVGLSEALPRQATFALGEGIPGWVAKHGALIALPDITKDPRYAQHPHHTGEPHAYICTPLPTSDGIIGAMSGRTGGTRNFTPTECRAFQTVGQMVGLVIAKQQLVEQRLATQRLESVVTSLSEIAHYAKNVIFTGAIAERMIDQSIANDQALAHLRSPWANLKRANQRIHKLVEDMLTFSREQKPRLADADINALVQESVRDLRYHSEKHDVTVETRLDPAMGKGRVDVSILADVLLNLISNAIDAVPAGRQGRVEVRTRALPDGAHYVIEVEDNGRGIPEEDRDKIFKLFFSTKGRRGTGIGLAATRKAAEKHGGTVTFESTPDVGTTFRVTLPYRPSRIVPASPESAASRGQRAPEESNLSVER